MVWRLWDAVNLARLKHGCMLQQSESPHLGLLLVLQVALERVLQHAEGGNLRVMHMPQLQTLYELQTDHLSGPH